MLKAIIIDDELPCRTNLRQLLGRFCADSVKIVAEAESVREAVEKAGLFQPELLFLDIELIGGNAFDVLDQLRSKFSFQTILVTAYDQFAIRAIKYSALDYLLKPIDIEELQVSVARARKVLESSQVDNPVLEKNTPQTIAISSTIGTLLLPIKSINYCEAKGSYCRISLREGRPITVSKNLGEMQASLPENEFFRIHRSFLVRLGAIRQLEPEKRGSIVLYTGEVLPVSRRRRHGLRSLLT